MSHSVALAVKALLRSSSKQPKKGHRDIKLLLSALSFQGEEVSFQSSLVMQEYIQLRLRNFAPSYSSSLTFILKDHFNRVASVRLMEQEQY